LFENLALSADRKSSARGPLLAPEACVAHPCFRVLEKRRIVSPMGGARHFHLGGPLEGQFCNKGSCRWSV